MQLLFWALIFFVGGEVIAQVPHLSNCPDLKVMFDFNLEQYLGKWYELQRYFAFFEIGGKCITADYSLNNDGTVKVVNKKISYITGNNGSIEGFAKLVGNPKESKLSVTFPSVPISSDAPYWVLGTDYKTYAIVWSCTNYWFSSFRYVWILTREPQPPVSVLKEAFNIIHKFNISETFLMKTDQENCPANY